MQVIRDAANRRPGRPAGVSREMRERLLDVALTSYANIGVAASSVRQIARDAGVTPAMVHYYFGGKEQLLAAVMEERLTPLVAGLKSHLDMTDDDPASLVTAFVRAIHALIQNHPWLPQLWVREILSDKGRLREWLITRMSPQVAQVLARRLAAAQARGALNPDIDPRMLVVSLVGLTMFPFAAQPIWRRVFKAQDVDGAALLQHTLALLANGLGVVHENQ